MEEGPPRGARARVGHHSKPTLVEGPSSKKTIHSNINPLPVARGCVSAHTTHGVVWVAG